jgi:hypothetical protein
MVLTHYCVSAQVNPMETIKTQLHKGTKEHTRAWMTLENRSQINTFSHAVHLLHWHWVSREDRWGQSISKVAKSWNLRSDLLMTLGFLLGVIKMFNDSGSQPSWCCHSLIQFFTLWPLTLKLFINYNFATVMKHNASSWYMWLPKVENHGSRGLILEELDNNSGCPTCEHTINYWVVL